MADELELLESLQRLDLAPGDVLVVRVKARPSAAQVEAMEQQLTAAFKGTSLEDVRVLIIEGDVDLAALRALP